METVETHASESKIRAASVALRLKHWSASTGQSYLDEQRLIVIKIEASSKAVFFMLVQHFSEQKGKASNWSTV